MSQAHDRRRRIVRVRTVERRIAQQELAHARREGRQIQTIVERIEVLARDNAVIQGNTDGASLAAISEMSTRLAYALRSTSVPLEQATQHVRARQSDHIRATTKAENASRFLEKAVQQDAADSYVRQNASHGFRAKVADCDS